jgi:hypothetical protein
MKLPGSNTIALNDAALMELMRRCLLCDVEAGSSEIRVTAVRHTYNETIFTVTTDAETAPTTIKEAP